MTISQVLRFPEGLIWLNLVGVIPRKRHIYGKMKKAGVM